MRALSCILLLISSAVVAQVRVSKLVIKSREAYQLNPSDIIVADTLVMQDSSRIVLNRLKPDNFIRAKVVIVGRNCLIDGKGISGANGRHGSPGRTPLGPCRDGSAGRNGARGLDGTQGVNLFLYIDEAVINGNLVIDLSGGNGGDGGNGGEGGGGSPGTLHCYGGNGGSGGDAGRGGNGGNGGTLTIGGLDAEVVRTLMGIKVIANTLGGNNGFGGFHGYGGAPGLGPSKMNGKPGNDGKDGERGRPGTNGNIQYEQQ
jgi:hypothetical protein